MSTPASRLEEVPLFDITGEPVDLEGQHYAYSTTTPLTQPRGDVR